MSGQQPLVRGCTGAIQSHMLEDRRALSRVPQRTHKAMGSTRTLKPYLPRSSSAAAWRAAAVTRLAPPRAHLKASKARPHESVSAIAAVDPVPGSRRIVCMHAACQARTAAQRPCVHVLAAPMWLYTYCTLVLQARLPQGMPLARAGNHPGTGLPLLPPSSCPASWMASGSARWDLSTRGWRWAGQGCAEGSGRRARTDLECCGAEEAGQEGEALGRQLLRHPGLLGCLEPLWCPPPPAPARVPAA